jgi:hypothetical protein
MQNQGVYISERPFKEASAMRQQNVVLVLSIIGTALWGVLMAILGVGYALLLFALSIALYNLQHWLRNRKRSPEEILANYAAIVAEENKRIEAKNNPEAKHTEAPAEVQQPPGALRIIWGLIEMLLITISLPAHYFTLAGIIIRRQIKSAARLTMSLLSDLFNDQD